MLILYVITLVIMFSDGDPLSALQDEDWFVTAIVLFSLVLLLPLFLLFVLPIIICFRILMEKKKWKHPIGILFLLILGGILIALLFISPIFAIYILPTPFENYHTQDSAQFSISFCHCLRILFHD